LLELRRYGVAFGEHVVLASVHLDVAARGVHVLVGPSAAGKSTLLRTLAGLNDSQPALRTWGTALYAGAPLGEGPRPTCAQQNARLFVSSVRENVVSALPDRAGLTPREQTERIERSFERLGCERLLRHLADDVVRLPTGDQRLVAVLRAEATGAALLLLDEPTVGLSEGEAEAVVRLVRRVAEHRAVVVTTHHQGHALALGGECFLLAGGRVQERGPTAELIARPTTDAGREFVARGNCSIPSPTAKAEELAPGVATPTPLPPAVRRAVDPGVGPRAFYWVERGRLGGLPRPGVVAELEHDLVGLARLGVTVLVTLEEQVTVPSEALARYSIRSIHFPIPDMRAPDVAEMEGLCVRIDALLAGGDVVAVHCLAGLGRTGTVLAAYLVWQGATPLEAIERVRAIRPRSIQSDEQAALLTRLAVHRLARSASSGES
jgi:atypical dual specificity phosphatase